MRHTLRSLWRQPSFALVAILTLALGIGATTAIFTVVNAVVLAPLPFDRPEEIVAVSNVWTRTGARSQNVSAPDFHDWKAQAKSFAALAYYSGGEGSVTVAGAADYAGIYAVTPAFFQALGARVAHGRLFTAAEEAPGGAFAVIITDAFWKERFNGSPEALGATVRFEDRVFTIVGILAPRMRFPQPADLYHAAWIDPETRSRSGHNYRVIGRLNHGVTLAQANAEMVTIAARLEAQYPDSNAGKSVRVETLQELLVGGSRRTLYVLLGAVGFVLLIACANVGNLLLARASVRAREMVIRAAVGAGRARLVRQLLGEALVLGGLSAVVGLWLADTGVQMLVALAPPELPRLEEIGVDGTALLFAVALALLSSIVFGLAPALQMSRVQLAGGLREGGKGTALGARGGAARSAFVVAEVALAVVLVFGAALLSRSLAALSAVDMGFDTSGLLVLRTVVPVSGGADAPRAVAFYKELLQDLRTVPGIASVGGVTSLPTAVRSSGTYAIEPGPDITRIGVSGPQALLTVVTPDYLPTLGVPLTRGRDFSDSDTADAPPVAIVNEALVRASFPNQDPIGRRIQCGLDTLEYMTIVGVVRDVRTAGPASPVQPEIYMPYEQHPRPATALNLVARTRAADSLSIVETIRRRIAARNPEVPLRATTMEGTLETAAATPRFRTALLVVFAAVALLLALAGVYSVMAYTVSQRVPELGVRMALGAAPSEILRLVMLNGAKLAGVGLLIGLALALFTGRILEGLLFNVSAHDPLALGAVSVIVAAATAVASYVPARRALLVDPMKALRAE